MHNNVPAAWHADPFGRHELRYWDGSRWTEHVHSRGVPGVDLPVAQMVGVTDVLASQEGARQSCTVAPVQGVVGSTLFTEQVLVVNQKVKVFGKKLGYAIYDQHGHQLGMVEELRRDLATTLSDKYWGRSEERREHRFRVVDMDGRILLAMTRPRLGFFQMKAKLVIDGPGGAPVGHIAHESHGIKGAAGEAAKAGVDSTTAIVTGAIGGIAGIFAGTAVASVQGKMSAAAAGLGKSGHARFGLEANGQRLGSVHAESSKEWDFRVCDPAEVEVARITKTWAGWAKERFTKADNYVVQMHQPLEEPFRSLVLASALAIDMELKQRGDQTRGSSVLGTRRYK
ncbi:DUF2510 domain-containing protein [Nocardioides sp. Y6]|uniref:DUF2510 domain-containing protein n=1 Tax=Nocardioides malaquae TaxID=2773426 RepID=A0ABR9RSI1_9ACTN|nr:DUF2510 domain-containing protein [Nocardioides malaquae]